MTQKYKKVLWLPFVLHRREDIFSHWIYIPCGFLSAHCRCHHITNDGTAQELPPGSSACSVTTSCCRPAPPHPLALQMDDIADLSAWLQGWCLCWGWEGGVLSSTDDLESPCMKLVSNPNLCPWPSSLPSSSSATWNSLFLRGRIRHNENSEDRQNCSASHLRLSSCLPLTAVVKSVDSSQIGSCVPLGKFALPLCASVSSSLK